MVSPNIFLRKKTDDLFYSSSSKADDFLVIVTITTISPFQVIVSPVPFVKFNLNKFFYFNQGVTLLYGATRGSPSLLRPAPY